MAGLFFFFAFFFLEGRRLKASVTFVRTRHGTRKVHHGGFNIEERTECGLIRRKKEICVIVVGDISDSLLVRITVKDSLRD